MTDQAPDFDAAFREKLAQLFAWRRDVRRFREEPVAPEILERLLAVADRAPSVGLSQPWRFVLVDAPAARAAIRASFEACNADALQGYDGDKAALYAGLKLQGLDEAPHQLAVFCDPDPDQGSGLGRRTMPETLDFSAVGAIQTLWLAARAEGIGLGWVSILDPEVLNGALDVPAEWRFIAYLCIGYPATVSDTPELETAGWETRSPVRDRILRR
ncbi:MAG: 5,6-dimethylbenzimidazole synthase [Alphaproteobacteria bacterium]|nr:5,6-dimethylbenzimidazole synthase [Alphaproteobacteria bacterium]MBO6863561.1 5,6-dimethylbenzimidazole synthase [Alphaproteobacteria bacterium]